MVAVLATKIMMITIRHTSLSWFRMDITLISLEKCIMIVIIITIVWIKIMMLIMLIIIMIIMIIIMMMMMMMMIC